MLRRHLWNAVFFAILLSLSSCYVTAEDKKFELGGKEGSATAIVEKERLKLEVAPGDKENYPKTFELKIGDCLVEIEAQPVFGITFRLKENGNDKGSVTGLNSIVAISGLITFKGSAETPILVKCFVKFGDQKYGNYYIPVQLSGDVPGGFKLSSESANMTEPAKSEDDDKKAHLGLILGIVGGSVAGFICLIGSSIAGFCIYRSHKNKVLQRDRTQLVTAKSMEEAISKTPETKPLESKTSETKPLEVDSKQAAPTSNSDKDKKKRDSEKGKDKKKRKSKSDDKKKRKSSESKKNRDSDDGTDKKKRKSKSDDKKSTKSRSDRKKRKSDDGEKFDRKKLEQEMSERTKSKFDKGEIKFAPNGQLVYSNGRPHIPYSEFMKD